MDFLGVLHENESSDILYSFICQVQLSSVRASITSVHSQKF